MNNYQLETVLNQLLTPQIIKDYCPNGLQVEGAVEVNTIITGVTASQELIDRAIDEKAEALLVHHGYFWKGEPEPIKGMKYRRIRALIEHGINLYAYHLPLDIHPIVGNNAQLASRLGITDVTNLETSSPSIAMQGQFQHPISCEELSTRLDKALNRTPMHISHSGSSMIRRIGWCTGGGQDYIDLAADSGLDAFISGEISERTVHSARELGIHYFAAGHHATERYGVKALGEWLATEHDVSVTFIDIDNPV